MEVCWITSLRVAAEERQTVSGLKAALAERAGLTTDSLKAAQTFMEVNQREKQRVTEYARELKGLFQKGGITSISSSVAKVSCRITTTNSPTGAIERPTDGVHSSGQNCDRSRVRVSF